MAAGLAALALAAGADNARAGDLFTFGNPAFCAPREPLRDFGFSRLPRWRGCPSTAICRSPGRT
jgi:hypothetical protein